mmetsp:Transcript_87171/g.164394  ORF Transcript_87171/g.164394 Transcript_87171/m.164394 type:complete len:876 (-) Transcript_87171:139-2766(-)
MDNCGSKALALPNTKPSWSRPLSEPRSPATPRLVWRVVAPSPIARLAQSSSEVAEPSSSTSCGLPPLAKTEPQEPAEAQATPGFFPSSSPLTWRPTHTPRPLILSNHVAHYNSQLEKTLQTAMEHRAGPDSLESVGQAQVRASRQLSELYNDLEALHTDATELQDRHLHFLAAQERVVEHKESMHREWDRKTFAKGRSVARATLKLQGEQLETNRRASDGAPSDVGSRATVARLDPAVLAAAAAKREHSKSRAAPKVMPQNVLTKAQEHAMSKFEDIDDGRASMKEVFDKIPNNAHRVVTKIEFYRERADLVLPRIEESFMRDDRGDQVVDVMKLHSKQTILTASSLSARGSARDVGSPPHGSFSARAVLQTGGLPHITDRWEERDSSGEDSAEDEPISLTLSPSCSMESLHQRAQRLAEMGQLRDTRIASVRSTQRSRLLERRLVQLTGLQAKGARKQIATRDRMLFFWVVLAIGTSTLVRVWRNFIEAYEDIRSHSAMDVLVREGSRHVMSNIQDVGSWRDALQRVRSGSIMPRTTMLLISGLQGKFMQELQARCSRHAYFLWCHLLRVAKFIAIMYRKRRLNRYAEIIKELINASWRGYRMVASMKVYLQQMNFLQHAMRNCVVMRRHIKQFILLPTLWEVETMILGEISMPPAALKNEIDMHRQYWDYKQRMTEVRQLSNQRYEWNKYRKAKLALGDRVEVYAQRQHIITPRKTKRALAKSEARKTLRDPRDMKRRQAVLFDKSQKGPDNTSGGSGISGLRARLSHPMMALIEKYRLSKEVKNNIVESIMHENTERWWTRYKEYKAECDVFSKEWRKWRLEIMALGKENQSSWPELPPIPRYPYELTKVDHKLLKSRVFAMLKQSEAGQLL